MKTRHVIRIGNQEFAQQADEHSGKPEFFRLPKKGGDPWFGITRALYYAMEQRGLIRLVRMRDRGKLRGITLVPYAAVAALLRSAQVEQSGQ